MASVEHVIHSTDMHALAIKTPNILFNSTKASSVVEVLLDEINSFHSIACLYPS